MADIRWAFTADYVETCNCDFGCPCNFSGIPTTGSCEAIVGYHIRTGHYDDVKLDGLSFVCAASWPKAIHEGNGTASLFIADKATPAQREALLQIASGNAAGEGPFAIFAATFTKLNDPVFAPVEFVADGENSRFSVPGHLDVALEVLTNPVTGAPNRGKIELEEGFIWKVANVAKTKIMRIFGGGLCFEHSGRNAFHTVVKFNED